MFLDYNLDIKKDSLWKIAHPASPALNYPFIVNECGVFYAGKEFYTKRYAKNDYQILYTVSGAAELEYNGDRWTLSEGSIVMIDCNQYHDYHTKKGYEHWTYYWLHAGGNYCSNYYHTIYKTGFKPYPMGNDNELIAHFNEILIQIDYTTELSYIRLSNAVSGILNKIALFLNSATPTPQEETVEKTIDYIKNNYKNTLNMDELSAHLNLSKFYLIKLFDKHVGITPYHYLIQCRINEAKKLLRATNHKINDIAQAVGFSDVSNFSRTFTKLTGMTPAKYRENL